MSKSNKSKTKMSPSLKYNAINYSQKKHKRSLVSSITEELSLLKPEKLFRKTNPTFKVNFL